MRFLKQALFGHAFASFTEAIRLCPSSAAYHANRASVALRLGRFTVALQDARYAAMKQVFAVVLLKSVKSSANGTRCAIARAPRHMRAHLRAAQACMHLDRPEDALELYRQALDLEPQCTPAQVLQVRSLLEVLP